RLLMRRYDVWHVHWPENLAHGSRALLRVPGFVLLILWARLRGTRIVWTVHNLEGHAARRPALELRLMRFLSRHLDGAIALSESSARAAAERYPGLQSVRVAVIPHGHYIGCYPNAIGREEARGALGIGRDQRAAVF